MITSRRSTAGVLAALVSGASASTTLASGFRLADQDALATARGEAFVATADNASAVYYNPAGLSRLQGSNLRAGLYSVYYDPTFRPPSGAVNSGTTYHNDDRSAVVPQFFYSYTPEVFPLSFGMGVYSPYGGQLSWPQSTGFRTVATKSSLTYIRFNPVMALRLAPQLSLGGGATADYGDIYLEQGLRPFYQPPNINFSRFKANGWGVGYNLGLLWQPQQKVSLGATFRSSTKMTVDGRTEFQQSPGGIAYTSLDAETEFKFPLTAVFGVSYRPTPKWNIEFDADYTDWSSFGTVTIHQQQRAPLGVSQNPEVIFDWQPSWMYEFGVTRYLDHGWHVSAGYVYSENAVPAAYYTPLVADMDRHFFSVGAGHRGRHFDLDVAYQVGYGPAHTVSGSQPSTLTGRTQNQSADGTYDFISHAVFVTVGLHF